MEKEKNNSLKLLENEKILLNQQEQENIFSQNYILFDQSEVVKSTIFYKKKDKNAKNFIKNNKKNLPIKKKQDR